MAENLNYKTKNSFCYDNNARNCTKYGRLYTWGAAMDSAGTWSVRGMGCGAGNRDDRSDMLWCSPTYPVRGVCPDGWHLPDTTEWKKLFKAVGGSSVAATKLKSTSGWYSNGNGTDAFSFSALPAGYREGNGRDGNGVYNGEGRNAFFWSSSPYYISGWDFAYYMGLYFSDGIASLSFSYDAISVRCLKN